ncbi:MAG: carbon-nitrogen hydrolase family protein [Bacteroidetes bacterium]|nr:carbon-nitrogen hydrolase family protein [Bacteroidota bacterium]
MPRIALIQQAASDDPASNVELGISNVRKAAADGAEIIAFAEVAFQTFFPQHRLVGDRFRFAESIPGPITEAFQALAAELGVVIVINLFEKDGERAFDSSPVIDADGTLLGVTRMMHITHYDGFYEQDYYDPGDTGIPVYDTRFGKIGVCICYDRHYPEYLRALALGGAEIVIVPQAGAVGEWPEGVYEAELMAGSFQNGFYMALANRVGEEDVLTFAGESFITDPEGRIVSRAPADQDAILTADLDVGAVETSHARQLFMKHRRSDQYHMLNAGMTDIKGSLTPSDHQSGSRPH